MLATLYDGSVIDVRPGSGTLGREFTSVQVFAEDLHYEFFQEWFVLSVLTRMAYVPR